MGVPTFRMGEDGTHFYWAHDCMAHLGEAGALIPQRLENRLPISDSWGWQVDQIEPMTVTPSIKCLRCGTHGFITNGEWVAV